MKTINTTLFVSLLFSCGGPDENQASEIILDTTSTAQIDSIIEYDFTNCPKAWNLEEALATPDSFCSVALLATDKKYTSIPSSLSSMPYLRKLDVHGNQIKEIPSFLSELTELDMSSNQLKSCPKGLENVPNLIRLNLSYNQIYELDPKIFELASLEELSLYNNHLETFPQDLFKLVNLRKLDFSGNRFHEIPSDFSKLKNLESLDFSEMGVNDSTFSSSMKNLKSLKTLRMGAIYVNAGPGQGNELTYIPEWIFSLDSLEELSLDYGYISVVSENISKLKNLKSLNLEGNSLTELPKSLTKLSNLSSLYLGDNNFSEEEEEKIKSWFSDKVEVTFEPQNIGD
jgi:Leucine-rich repeat (LRR) protein